MSRTVLLLDDDANFRASVTPSLEAHGLRVVIATKASSATKVLEREKPVLAVVDGLLPDLNGIEWIEQTREAGHNLMIFFVSAFFRDLTTFRHLTQTLRVNKVFYKPIAVDRFAKAVADALAVTEGSGVLNLSLRPELIGEPLDNIVDLDRPKCKEEIIFPDSNQPDVEGLRAEYTRALPQMTEGLVQAVQKIREDHERTSWIRDALRRSHNIHGTAGSYGLNEISNAAARIEEQLRGLQKLGRINWGEIDLAVESIEEEVARTPVTKSDRVRARSSIAAAPPVSAGTHATLEAPLSAALGPKVLVLEDDSAMVAYLRSAFDESLLQMVVASTADDAISLADKEQPNVVLVGAPLGDPQDVPRFTQALRKVPGCAEVPLILLSMDGDAGACHRAVALGADLLLTQPIDPRRLERVIDVAWRGALKRELVVQVLSDGSLANELNNSGMVAYNTDDLNELADNIVAKRPHVVVVGPNVATAQTIGAIRCAAWETDFVLIAVGDLAPEEGFNAGADDVVARDGSLVARIRAKARRAAEFRTQATEQRHGLLLRRGTNRALDAGLAAALRHGHSYAVGFLKPVVDASYEDADAARVRLQSCIAQSFRREDVRGVWDDELLAVGFDGANADTMSDVIDRLNTELSRLNPNHEGPHFVAGLASYPLDGDSVRSLGQVAYNRLTNVD